MDQKDKIRFVLREHYGRFESVLEHQYEDAITNKLFNGTTKDKEEWITYNQVILELKHSLKNILLVKEVQYKLTDNGESNKSIIETIERVKTLTPELERLYNKIINF